MAGAPGATIGSVHVGARRVMLQTLAKVDKPPNHPAACRQNDHERNSGWTALEWPQHRLAPMIHRSPFSPVDLPRVPLVEFIFQNVAEHTHKTAIVDGLSGTALTYGQLLNRIQRTAGGLIARGVRKGDVCAIYAPNVPDYAVAFYAVTLAGGIMTTVNPLYSVAELRHQLQDAEAKFLVSAPSLLRKARHASQHTDVREVFTMGDKRGATPFSALTDATPARQVSIDPMTDIAVLPYSSGTTGLPKGVMLTHHHIAVNVSQLEAAERLQSSEVLLATLPFYHIYGMVVVLNQGLRAGVTLVTLPEFTAKAFLEVIEFYRVTTAYLVPPLVRTLATYPQIDRYDLSSLRDVISGAAPLPEGTARRCSERIGCGVRQIYGLTEASPATHVLPRDHTRPNSVGVPVPNTECRVVGVGHRRDVRPGELGEVWIRGPQVMKGYLNNPEATKSMVNRQGWLRTGDIGFVDTEGYLYVVDRAKELVKFRGLHYGEQELLRSMVEDISARRLASHRLETQALLLDSVRECVIATDARHRVTFWNRGAEAQFGYTSREALGQPIDKLIIPHAEDVRREWIEEFSTVMLRGRWQGTALRRRRDGSLLWTDVVVSLVTGSAGIAPGYIALHRDVTELRRNQEMLEESREQMRKLASRLMEVREEERSAISRELHDELGQALTRLKIDLRSLSPSLSASLHAQRTGSMAALVDTMVATVQQISAQLRPAILDDLGLEAAIEAHTQDFAERNGCSLTLDLKIAALTPRHDRDTVLFRILQEALTNVSRHARAGAIRVRAWIRDADLHVSIDDDGVGIPAGKWSCPHSLGLVGMRERAESVGGRLEVRGREGRGTTVFVCVPIDGVVASRDRLAAEFVRYSTRPS